MRKKTISSQRTRRLGVSEAKSRWSEVVREALQGPTVIHSRGKDLAVVLAIEDYERLSAGQPAKAGGSEFLERVEVLKKRYGGGVEDFAPARLDFVPSQPFARKTRRG